MNVLGGEDAIEVCHRKGRLKRFRRPFYNERLKRLPLLLPRNRAIFAWLWLDLADAFGRYAVFGSQFVQGQTAIVLQPAAFNDTAAAVVQLRQGVFADLWFAGRSGLVWTTDGWALHRGRPTSR